jgi:hypothetical protein
MVPILRLSLRLHATGTSFVLYLEIDTGSVISPKKIARKDIVFGTEQEQRLQFHFEK